MDWPRHSEGKATPLQASQASWEVQKLVGLFGDQRQYVPHPGNLLRLLYDQKICPVCLGTWGAGVREAAPQPTSLGASKPQGPLWKPTI